MPLTTQRAPRAIALLVCVAAALGFANTARAQIAPAGDSTPQIYAPMVTTAGVAAAAVPPAVLPTDWLPRVNTYRALAGVPPVGEDALLSAGCQQHARYMAANNQLASDQDPASPLASAAGLACARHSSLWLAQNPLATPLDPLAGWMASVDDRLWLLYPTASDFGFGFAAGGGQSAAALDLRSRPDFDADAAYTGWPVRYPGAGQIGVPPDQSPITLLWPRLGQAPVVSATALRTAGGEPIAHTASAELPGGHKGLQIVPLTRLPQRTTIIVEVAGSYAGAPFSLSWQFATGQDTAGDSGAGTPPTPPSP